MARASRRRGLSWAVVPVLGAAARVLQAQQPAVPPPGATDTVRLDSAVVRLPTVVSVTREPSRSTLTLPFALTVTSPDSSRPGQAHLFLDQALMLVPGAVVSNRFNPSQDARLSIRGFGARSAFGVRSVRVLRDGMPLTLPDGQTPVDVLDLETVGRTEVIRGAASALYGNASGGVVDLRSAPYPESSVAGEIRSWGGSDALRRVAALAGGRAGPLGYQAVVGHTSGEGARAYARQRLTQGYLRAGATHGATEYSGQLLAYDMPLGENPGALTRAQLDSAPAMADPASVRKRARKAVRQLQGGVQARRATAQGGELTAQLFAGTRTLENPLAFAVVGVDRLLGGASARAVQPVTIGGVDNRLTIGADLQGMRDDRRNWANCNAVATANASCPAAGRAERGALQLDQRERVSSLGAYARDEVTLGALLLSAGVRTDAVRFRVDDRFTSDQDDSGARTMRAVSPMVGGLLRLSPAHSVYVSVATAFETPTTTELGNQPDGSAGVNHDLSPQRSTTVEAGMKGITGVGVRYGLAAYVTRVRDELIPFELPGGGGRTYFRNAGRTRRDGVEAELSALAGPFEVGATYAWSHFRFQSFGVNGAEFGGNTIPGVPEQVGQGSVAWRGARAFVVGEGIVKSRVWANDANTASAPGYAVVNLRAGLLPAATRAWLSPVVAVHNLFDRRYVSSVAINASGASLAATKFYEPAAGRTWLIGLSAGAR